MRTLYLIRHARPLQPEGPRRCIAATDLPLDDIGREQCEALRRWAQRRTLMAVFTAPAQRCRATAAALGPDAVVREELREVEVGEWENRTFEEIRRRWPQEYAARGEHMGTTAPPGGESFCRAGARLGRALEQILRGTQGDVAVVSHGGVLRGWLCNVLGRDADRVLQVRQPWGGVTTVAEENGRFFVTGLGLRPAMPGPLECEALFERCGTPEQVRLHGAAVARRALELAGDAPVDRELLAAACLLHDLCRTAGHSHPRKTAALLAAEGWPRLADAVGRHHDLGEAPPPEAELLYLADKLLAGTEPVTIQTRFENARKKCDGPAAVQAWQRRYDDTLRMAEKYGVTG